jgi:hypothetical protein
VTAHSLNAIGIGEGEEERMYWKVRAARRRPNAPCPERTVE